MYINLTIAREPAQIIVRNLLYLDIYITIISKYDVGGFNVAKNIDAKLKNIQGIFSNSQDSILGQDGCFIIPDYQRAYNWRFNEQCDKLWQDIESFIDGDEGKKNETYFFGSIIVNNDSDKLYLIDGQQRITTFMLLLKALLIKINSVLENITDDEDAEGIENALKDRRREIISCLYSIDEDNIFLITKGSKKLSELPIKYLNQSINEEFPDEIKVILHADNHNNIEKEVAKIKYKRMDNKYTNFFRNYVFFMGKINDFDSTKLNRFAKAFLKECQVIVVISYQTEEAIEIFNSLNSTGMPLADADILSAKLYSNYDTNKIGFNQSWKNIVKQANSLDAQKIATIDDILNQYMYIIRAKNNEKDTTLPGVRRYFTDINKDPLRNPKTFISDIEKIIAIWQDNKSTEELVALKQLLFKHNNNFKFFYVTYLYFNSNETDDNKENFVEALLKLFAILSIKESGYSSAKFKIFLIALNMEIGAGASSKILVEKINDHIRKEFNEKDIAGTIIDSAPNNALVYLNEYLFAKENGVILNLDILKIEIEHIMPASGRNLSSIREDANMNEDDFHQYADKLGNKILLEQPINGAISNDWFKTKKQTSILQKRGYKDSNFPIAQSLISYSKDKWEKDDIDKATQKAAKRIIKFIFN